MNIENVETGEEGKIIGTANEGEKLQDRNRPA